MIVNTKRLFIKLLRSMRIEAVGDVGSLDCADAVIFRQARPLARIYAFEPNPYNLRLIARDTALKKHAIQVLPWAATNRDGEAEFFISAADYSRADPRRGMSSLNRRSGEWAPAEVARVKTTRLDTFFRLACPSGARLAVWIDAEGGAYEVIEGMRGIARWVHLLHVEVEAVPCVCPTQKLYPAVKSLLEGIGFTELATDGPRSMDQFNALFVRTGLPGVVRPRIAAWRLHATVRHLAGTAVRSLRRNRRFGFTGSHSRSECSASRHK